MKRSVLVILACALGVTAPASGGDLNAWVPLEWRTVAPCAAACPYWLDTTNIDVDNDGQEDVHFDTCGNPDGTDGSLSDVPGLPYEEGIVYDDIMVGPRADGAIVLVVEIYPTVDWDLFICSEEGRLVDPCASGAEECARVFPENCDNAIGPQNPLPVGCRERSVIQIAADRRYVLRAYNFSDPFPLEGRYCWSSSGSCA